MKIRIAAILMGMLLATVDVACFSKPDAPQLTGGSDIHDAATPRLDAATSDPDAKKTIDAAAVCTTVASFDGGPANGCGPGFGPALVSNATVAYNGTLDIMTTSAGGSASCTTTSSYGFTAGFSVDVTQLPSGTGASALFKLSIQNGQQSLTVRAGNTWQITCPGSGTFTTAPTVTVPFSIRIIGNGAPNEVLTVEVASGGGPYSTVDTCAALVGSAGSATATLEGAGSSSTATIAFDNLQACQ